MKKYLLLLALTTAPILCSALEEPESKELEEKEVAAVAEEDSAQKRSAFIFLDDSEAYRLNKEGNKYFGPVSTEALLAIIQKAGPLFISGSLLHKLLHTDNYISLLTGTAIKTPSTNPRYDDIIEYFQSTFKPQDWIIRKVRGKKEQKYAELYCLIPRDYHDVQHHALQELKNPDQISPLEASLGIKIDHMEPIPQGLAALRNYFSGKYASYDDQNYALLAATTGTDFMITLPDLFVPKSYYIKNKQQPPQWIMYIVGHGSASSATIAAIPIKKFKNLLAFLENNLSMLFFIYSSCDAAGFNSQAAFNEVFGELVGRASAETYSFYIVTHALTDASTLGPIISFNTATKKLETDTYFNLFILSLIADPSNYKKAFMYLFPDIQSLKNIFNIPQVRPPFMWVWVPLTEFEKALVPITQTMSLTRKKPLTIKQYSAETKTAAAAPALKDPTAILLYANRVPFTIQITTSKMPAIISMLPGNSTHFIDELQIPNINFYNIELPLMQKYGTKKIIWLAKVHAKDEIVRDMIVNYEPAKWPVFYFKKANNIEYIKDLNLEKLQEVPYESKEYDSYLKDPALTGGLDGISLFRDNIKKVQNLEKAIKRPQQKQIGPTPEEDFFKNVETGNIQAVKDALNRDINNINRVNEDYQTPLIVAAKANNTDMLRLLVSYGPDITKRDLEWKSATDYTDAQGALMTNELHLRIAKASQLLTHFLFPAIERADRRNLRYILQKIEKNDPKAITYLQQILQFLVDQNAKQAIATLHSAYGGSLSTGADFTIKNLEEPQWRKVLATTVYNKAFDFLDNYRLLVDPTTY